jgi:DNA-binding protein
MAKKKSAAKKTTAPKKKGGAATRSSYIAKAPIRRLMKSEGAGLVAEDAVTLLIEKLTEAAIDVTKKAVKMVKDEKRKRVTAADITACC